MNKIIISILILFIVSSCDILQSPTYYRYDQYGMPYHYGSQYTEYYYMNNYMRFHTPERVPIIIMQPKVYKKRTSTSVRKSSSSSTTKPKTYNKRSSTNSSTNRTNTGRSRR